MSKPIEFKRHSLIGISPEGKIFITVELRGTEKGTELSITGVEKPTRAGEASGCGQMADTIRYYLERNQLTNRPAFWTEKNLLKMLDIWDRWHLNSMRPDCEHQRKNWKDFDKEITTYEFNRTSETNKRRSEIKERILNDIKTTGGAHANEEERRLLCLPYFFKLLDPTPPDGYELYKEHTATRHWTSYKDHPDGYLGKPCEICGYGYGTAWIFEKLPLNVITWLKTIPETDELPECWK